MNSVVPTRALIGYAAAVNAGSFGLFYYDKQQAINHQWRVPEKTLQLSALMGGWVGGILAMKTFKHKTVKEPFRTIYFSCVALNAGIVAAAIYTKGRSYSSTQSFVTKKKPTVRRVKEGPSAEYADSVVHLESKPEAKAQLRQRCFAVCTARSYNLSTVRSVMAKLNGQNIQVQRGSNWDDECMHFVMSDKSRRINEGKLAEAFFMKDGCMVTWNTTKELEAHLLKNIKEAEVHPYGSLKDAEEMEYIVDELRPSGVVHEDIVIGHKDDTRESVIAKLAFSHGLARSTQLGVLENHLSEFLANIEHLPEFMIQGQEPPLNSKQVMVKSGQLLHIRGLLNLHSELVDASPEFYWSRSELGRYYEQVSRLMEMQPRIRVLNQRLDHANRLVDWMENHLSKKHGTRMEVIIIALIAVEVCFELMHYIQ